MEGNQLKQIEISPPKKKCDKERETPLHAGGQKIRSTTYAERLNKLSKEMHSFHPFNFAYIALQTDHMKKYWGGGDPPGRKTHSTPSHFLSFFSISYETFLLLNTDQEKPLSHKGQPARIQEIRGIIRAGHLKT